MWLCVWERQRNRVKEIESDREGKRDRIRKKALWHFGYNTCECAQQAQYELAFLSGRYTDTHMPRQTHTYTTTNTHWWVQTSSLDSWALPITPKSLYIRPVSLSNRIPTYAWECDTVKWRACAYECYEWKVSSFFSGFFNIKWWWFL